MGFSAIVRDLPRLIRRIGETARAIVGRAGRIALSPSTAPNSACASRARCGRQHPRSRSSTMSARASGPGAPSRAKAMRPHVDHVLCLLPFEPAELERLDGPPGTFVGHRLTHEPGILAAAAAQRQRSVPSGDAVRTLLLLPGSRKGEVSRLIEPFRETLDILRGRGNRLRVLLPTVPNVRAMVEAATADWPETARDHRRRRGQMAGLRRGRCSALRVGHRLAGTGARRRAAGCLLQARLAAPTG